MLNKKMALSMYQMYINYRDLLEILINKQDELIDSYIATNNKAFETRKEILEVELKDYQYELQEINNILNSLLKITIYK